MPPLDGILRIPKQMPRDQREWEQFTRRLNEAITFNGVKALLSEAMSVATREDTDLVTVLQRITDEGRAEDQRFLPTVTFGNVASVQSTEPLTATAGASTATIHIAAHNLHTDFGPIAYNAGSVTGLTLNTRYYVYTDDPDYEGGAVTYLATTSRPNVPANSGRYFVGTIETPGASANTVNIAAATSANPIEIQSSTSHGWSTGDIVEFAFMPDDFAALNGNQYEITVVDADQFTIDADGAAFDPYTSGGTATRVVAATGNDFGGGGGGYIP